MREVLCSERTFVAVQRGPEQHACKLPNVAGPAVAHEHGQRVVADRQRLQTRMIGEALQQVTGKGGNVAAALPERRQVDGGGANPLRKAG